jgi:murein DD-endopeptidase MepM/ murein hydrolase activator NlpD
MLRGKNIIHWRRTVVAVLVAVCASVGSLRLLVPNLMLSDLLAVRETEPAVTADVDVAGRLDTDFVAETPVARPAPEPVTIALSLDHTRRAGVYLQEAGLDGEAAQQWETYFDAASGGRNFEKGHSLTILKDPETGDLRALRYNLDDRIAVSEQTYGGGVFRTSQELIRYVFRPVAVSFKLRSNFWQDAGHQDLPRAIIDTLDYAFRNDRPLSSLPRGSNIKLIYQEKVSRDGSAHFTTGIQAASISFGGKTLTAFAFRDENGEPRLYDSNGVALGPKALLMPVNFDRVSSEFSLRRYHPILHEYRAHEGVDLAARYGTPVKAVADGRVDSAGWCGGLGRCVRIRHEGGIVSIYGHLSRIAEGVKEGSPIRVGQFIGQVGSTGLSTGPHLHYAIEKDGQYVNPLSQDLGVNHRVSPRLRTLFDHFKQDYLTALNHLPSGGHFTVALPSASTAGNAVIRTANASQSSGALVTRHAFSGIARVEHASVAMPISGRASIMR